MSGSVSEAKYRMIGKYVVEFYFTRGGDPVRNILDFERMIVVSQFLNKNDKVVRDIKIANDRVCNLFEDEWYEMVDRFQDAYQFYCEQVADRILLLEEE